MVTVLSSILIRDVSLLGSSKVPPGQRSHVQDVGSIVRSSNSGVLDGLAEGFIVGLIVAASATLVVTNKVAVGSNIMVGPSDDVVVGVEVGEDEAVTLGLEDNCAVGAME